MKKLRCILMTFVMMLCIVLGTSKVEAYTMGTATFSDDITILINGVEFDGKAVLINKVVYVPIRALGYAINAETTWDGQNRKIIMETLEEKIEMKKITQTLDGKFDSKKAYFTDDYDTISTLNTFISKNQDRTYKVIMYWEYICYDKTGKVLREASDTIEYQGFYNSETKGLDCIPKVVIDFADGKTDDPKDYACMGYVLKDEILYLTYLSNSYDRNECQMERF